MTAGLFIAFAVAVALAWALASRLPAHRPIAILLSVELATDVAHGAMEVGVVAPLRAALDVAVPWTGWARAAGLLANAFWLVSPAALVAAALVVFAGRRPWPAAVVWAGAVAALAVLHPIAGDGSLARMLVTVQVAAVVCSLVMGLAWYRRRDRKPAGTAEITLAMIVTTEAVVLLGAWRVGLFEHWPVSQALYLILFGALVLVQGRFLWSSPQPSA